jgi:IclR family transcriptional regulator, KDG regulon repressor
MDSTKVTKNQNGYNVRAVERALQILECFDDAHPEKGVSEIAQAVDLHKATTHRIMTTLLNFGYLERADDGQKYRLGIRLTELGFKVVRRMDLRREAISCMNQLNQRLGEGCDLSIFDHGNVFYIEVIQGNYALSITAAVGKRLPAHCTASGKLFLAHLPAQELDVILGMTLPSFTRNTITSAEALRQQLETIHQQGYAVDDEELETGIRAVAAPIFNREGKMIAAISVPSPTSRLKMERIPEIAEALKEATQAVSHRMGWNG